VLGVFSLWQIKRRCSFSQGEIETKSSDLSPHTHVITLVPKVRE